MARINVEDSIFKDIRFNNLCIKLQNVDTAMGALVRSWIIGQKWYLTENKMIPVVEWEKQLIPDAVLEVGLAERVGEFIRICGADEQFGWLSQKIESGRLGGQASAAKRRSSTAQAKASKSNPLYSSSFSISKNKELNTNTGEQTSQSSVPLDGFIKIYSDSLKKRYGDKAKLIITGKTAGQIKRLVKEIGLPKSCDLIQVYFQMEDPWFEKKGHDFDTFLTNLQKIGVALDTGKKDPASKFKTLAEHMAEKKSLEAVK